MDTCKEIEGNLVIHHYEINAGSFLIGKKEKTTILSPNQIGEVSVKSTSDLWANKIGPGLFFGGIGLWILLGSLVQNWFYQDYARGLGWIWVISVWIICLFFLLMSGTFFSVRTKHYSRITIHHKERRGSTVANILTGDEDEYIATILKIKKNSIVK